MRRPRHPIAAMLAATLVSAGTVPAQAMEVTYAPYIQPGDASPRAHRDVKVIAWQTDETTPHPEAYRIEYGPTPLARQSARVNGRVVDDYLSADPSLPVPATASGAHVNYYATLTGLKYDTTYAYHVYGPGLPADGFHASFHTRKLGDRVAFQVVGDEGFFPTVPGSDPKRVINWEARIVHEMFEADTLDVPGAPDLPKPDFALNTGDNVYNLGTEGDYRDFWMPVWNNDVSSNETGAPYIRHIPYYIVAGNHDLGGTGSSANLLGTADAGRYSGNSGGGDALAYFNNYYFPLNGPTGVDLQQIFNGDTHTPDGFYFAYQGTTYDSPAAIEALRASTEVNTGRGTKRQIDHMGNYSFDQGNVHFVFLDGNPHLFNALLSYEANYLSPPTAFPTYPGVLRDWLIKDLDSSDQPWKIVVFHHPSFSSSNSTVRNFQMRRVAKLLEDHGVNLVFNGHAHNYQRTHPLRALARVADAPDTAGEPAVAIDTAFDGARNTVPDGVLYLVEGAGGRDSHDSGGESPRGNANVVDEDDSATGTKTFGAGLTFPNGPAAWLDTHLTNPQMAPFIANAGQGPKITAVFKGRVFSFGHVVVDDNRLSLYQISEPLQERSSATADNPYPFGTDINGEPVNDPIPDTLLDPATGEIVTAPATGRPALLDAFTVTKPRLHGRLIARLSAPREVDGGDTLRYRLHLRNRSGYALNGTQVILPLPDGARPAGSMAGLVQLDDRLVLTVGRLAAGETRDVQFTLHTADRQAHERHRAHGRAHGHDRLLKTRATVRSATAMPVQSNPVVTRVDD
ncbi:hypothetical protein G3580_02065 [Nitrogeniibacter mangrovi]|uniref:Calcineurin-like phosphoesterase domain-containing protein n=1 Tax=Nitrogeniibacter mangrovi TaxID=2016596 RepID=A0A6C1B0T8_9RHOO|nr:metallophosphoesterase [Nitrogeniibacter mangrovi]QID16515.1 hypothetical protein G3580_02065 [Nitrogeniibacter mangrovi]